MVSGCTLLKTYQIIFDEQKLCDIEDSLLGFLSFLQLIF